MNPVGDFLERERVVTLLGMAALVGACWAYLWTGAGTGMSALDMTTVALFPHRLAGAIGTMDPPLPTVILMWWVMMTPGAAPLHVGGVRAGKRHMVERIDDVRGPHFARPRFRQVENRLRSRVEPVAVALERRPIAGFYPVGGHHSRPLRTSIRPK